MAIVTIILDIENILGILMYRWSWDSIKGDSFNLITSLNYYSLIYGLFELSIVMFSLLIFFQQTINIERNIYIILITIFLFSIIWAGTFNSYFGGSLGSLEKINGTNETSRYASYAPGVIGNNLFWPSLIIFPFFSPTQHLMNNSNILLLHTGYPSNYFNGIYNVKFFIWQKSNFAYSENHVIYQIGSLKALKWNIMWFMPWIHSILFISMSIVIKKFKK